MTYEEALAVHGVVGGDYMQVIRAAGAEYKALVATLPADLKEQWDEVVIGHEFFDGEIEIQLGYLKRFIAEAKKVRSINSTIADNAAKANSYFPARFGGKCNLCTAPVAVGQRIRRGAPKGYVHEDCGDAAMDEFERVHG